LLRRLSQRGLWAGYYRQFPGTAREPRSQHGAVSTKFGRFTSGRVPISVVKRSGGRRHLNGPDRGTAVPSCRRQSVDASDRAGKAGGGRLTHVSRWLSPRRPISCLPGRLRGNQKTDHRILGKTTTLNSYEKSAMTTIHYSRFDPKLPTHLTCSPSSPPRRATSVPHSVYIHTTPHPGGARQATAKFFLAKRLTRGGGNTLKGKSALSSVGRAIEAGL